jgi:phage/plasmid-like protein (TIGR03299 family)
LIYLYYYNKYLKSERNMFMPALQERVPTWEKIGWQITQPNIHDALEEVGLNFDLKKVPLRIENYNLNMKYSALIRTTENGAELISMVPKDYEIYQPSQMLEFLQHIDENITLERAGIINKKMIWTVAKMSEPFNVLGDEIYPYIIVENGLGVGKAGSVRVCLTLLRMVCQNQFNAAFDSANGVIRINHTASDIEKQIEQASNVLYETKEYIDSYTRHAEEMAQIKISDSYVENLVRDIANVKLGEKVTEQKERRMQTFYDAYNADDNQNFRGTAWGVMNAYTDYTTHLPALRNSDGWDEKRFMNLTLNNRTQTRMFNALHNEHKCPICGSDH